MVFFVLANIGLNGAGVFYNALLPIWARMMRWTGSLTWHFAYGYLGGLLLVVHLAMVMALEGDWIIPFCMGPLWNMVVLLCPVHVQVGPRAPYGEGKGVPRFGDSARLAIKRLRDLAR
ncbi:MAG: hypothetical protein CM15mP105_0680 [Methanobacteriota archaeon]|nr:MAG: hypothetical protein CM15mP105_0680 [Euryarchaeota archaeon]